MSRTKRNQRVYPDPYRSPKFRPNVIAAISAIEQLEEQGINPNPRLKGQANLSGSYVAHVNEGKAISCYREGRTLEEQRFLNGTTLVRGQAGSPMADCFFVEMTHDDYCRVWWVSCPRNPMAGDIITDFDGSRYEVLSVYEDYGMTLRWVGRG